MPSPDVLLHLLEVYRYLLVFPLAVIEGPIITILTGFLSAQGFLSFKIVFAVLIAADLVGDSIFYAIGRWGKLIFGSRLNNSAGNQNRLYRAGQYLSLNPGRTLLFGKLTHSAGFAILLASGAVRMSYGKFLWYNLLGTIPKTFALLLVGYLIGSQYQSINSYITKIGFVLGTVLVLFIAWFIWRKLPEEV